MYHYFFPFFLNRHKLNREQREGYGDSRCLETPNLNQPAVSGFCPVFDNIYHQMPNNRLALSVVMAANWAGS